MTDAVDGSDPDAGLLLNTTSRIARALEGRLPGVNPRGTDAEHPMHESNPESMPLNADRDGGDD